MFYIVPKRSFNENKKLSNSLTELFERGLNWCRSCAVIERYINKRSFRMKKTEEKIQKTMEYSKWLANQIDELCIKQCELAAAVGKTPKTISCYKNGESMPDEATRSAIEAFIEEHSVYDGFRHIPSKEFSEILLRLLDEFGLSQVELAKEIGKYQKISANTYPKKKKQIPKLNMIYYCIF